MIKSIGIEALSVERLKSIYVRFGDKFLSRYFSNEEITYILSKRDKVSTLSGRLALKIAFCKAMGEIITLKEIKISNDDKGKPYIVCNKLKDIKCEASISHDGNLAIATVILGN